MAKIRKLFLQKASPQTLERALNTLLDGILIWGKVFKNGPSKICGEQTSKTFN